MSEFAPHIFDRVAGAILAEYPNAFVAPRVFAAPLSFPAVSIIETNDILVLSEEDGSKEEQMSQLSFMANVYADSGASAKEECERIMVLIDAAFRSFNIMRTMLASIPNAADPSIFRMVARFVGVVGKQARHVMMG